MPYNVTSEMPQLRVTWGKDLQTQPILTGTQMSPN